MLPSACCWCCEKAAWSSLKKSRAWLRTNRPKSEGGRGGNIDDSGTNDDDDDDDDDDDVSGDVRDGTDGEGGNEAALEGEGCTSQRSKKASLVGMP